MNILIVVTNIALIIFFIIMMIVYVSTRNHIIDIVNSFEIQNSSSYSIRMEVFNRAIKFLSNIQNMSIDRNAKLLEMSEVFDNMLMVSQREETLKVFETITKKYFEEDQQLDEKLFLKFKTCVRMEFGTKKYKSSFVQSKISELYKNNKMPLNMPSSSAMKQPQSIQVPTNQNITTTAMGSGVRMASSGISTQSNPGGGTIMEQGKNDKE